MAIRHMNQSLSDMVFWDCSSEDRYQCMRGTAASISRYKSNLHGENGAWCKEWRIGSGSVSNPAGVGSQESDLFKWEATVNNEEQREKYSEDGV